MSNPRHPIVAANWKMHTTLAQARELAARSLEAIAKDDLSHVDVVLCPPYISLAGVREVLGGLLELGAQNMHWIEQGAYTGEISPAMLAPLCRYVIIGHSERRQHFGETDEMVHHKVRAALAHHLTPIVCVGESLQQREAGETHAWVALQIRGALHGLEPRALSGIVLAYEPIWAIGTGKAASGEDANAVALTVREVLASMSDTAIAQSVRIQYGGSVHGSNAEEFLSQPEIDGALVGGASLKADEFAKIVHAARRWP